MAELESGETRKQRILMAEQVKSIADNLAAPRPIANASAASAASETQKTGSEETENPWKSEGIPDTTFDDVVGMEDVKELIRSRVIDQIKYPELYDQYGLKGGTGVLLFGLCVVFQLVTLPTEFNASSRAVRCLSSSGMLAGEELTGARKTLTAAALTYVAALAVALLQVLRLLAIVSGGRRRR